MPLGSLYEPSRSLMAPCGMSELGPGGRGPAPKPGTALRGGEDPGAGRGRQGGGSRRWGAGGEPSG